MACNYRLEVEITPPAGPGQHLEFFWYDDRPGSGVLGYDHWLDVSLSDGENVKYTVITNLVDNATGSVICSTSDDHNLSCGEGPEGCGLSGTFSAIASSKQPETWTLGLTAAIVGYPPATNPVNVTWNGFSGQQPIGPSVFSVSGSGVNATVSKAELQYNQWYTIVMSAVDANGCVVTDAKQIRITSECPDGYYWNGVQCVEIPDPGGDPGPELPYCADGYYYDPELEACVPSICSSVPSAPQGRSGGRSVPGSMYAELVKSHHEHFWVIAIKPIYGDWECYNSIDISVELPSYNSNNGLNAIPPLKSLPSRGVDLSSIATTLKMEADSSDAIIVNFDEKKLKNGYYQNAEYELFRVSINHLEDRWVASSGQVGLSQIGESSSTLELLTWVELAQRPVGDEQTYGCRHEFGNGMCRNSMLHDGPLLSNWTKPAEVVSVTNRSRFVVEVDGGTDDFYERLQEGFVTFNSGDNQYLKRDVKSGKRAGSSNQVEISLQEIANYDIAVGDELSVSAGCTKMPEMCKAYGNFKNYGGFPFIPLREGVMRRD